MKNSKYPAWINRRPSVDVRVGILSTTITMYDIEWESKVFKRTRLWRPHPEQTKLKIQEMRRELVEFKKHELDGYWGRL